MKIVVKNIKKSLLALTLCIFGSAKIQPADNRLETMTVHSGSKGTLIFRVVSVALYTIYQFTQKHRLQRQAKVLKQRAQDDQDARLLAELRKRHQEADEQFEQNCGVIKVHSLQQGYYSLEVENIYKESSSILKLCQNCSFYAGFYADLLIKCFEQGGELYLTDSPKANPFQSEEIFKAFLQKFDLTLEFDETLQKSVPNEKVKQMAAKVNPKILCVVPVMKETCYESNFENLLNNSNCYQVLMYKKGGHWVAFGIDYQTDKIYFVDSLDYVNIKGQKYSDTDRKIISLIRAAMSKLKDFAGEEKAASGKSRDNGDDAV
jgi:hypothetical protein